MSDITTRVRRVTADLEVLQRELDAASHPGADRSAIVDELVAGDLLNDLKNAVDNVRHFLWAYIEATTQNPEDLKNAMQGYRMQRVTEMLRVMRSDEPELTKTKGAHSFFEEINSIAHAAVDRYEDKDHQPPDTGKAGKK